MDKLEKLKRLIIKVIGNESFSTSYKSEEVFVLYINAKLASNLFLKNDKITIDVDHDGTPMITVLDKSLGPASLGYVVNDLINKAIGLVLGKISTETKPYLPKYRKCRYRFYTSVSSRCGKAIMLNGKLMGDRACSEKEIKLYIEAMYRLKFNNYIEKEDTIYINIEDTP